jgi:hypothetical protein
MFLINWVRWMHILVVIAGRRSLLAQTTTTGLRSRQSISLEEWMDARIIQREDALRASVRA